MIAWDTVSIPISVPTAAWTAVFYTHFEKLVSLLLWRLIVGNSLKRWLLVWEGWLWFERFRFLLLLVQKKLLLLWVEKEKRVFGLLFIEFLSKRGCMWDVVLSCTASHMDTWDMISWQKRLLVGCRRFVWSQEIVGRRHGWKEWHGKQHGYVRMEPQQWASEETYQLCLDTVIVLICGMFW